MSYGFLHSQETTFPIHNFGTTFKPDQATSSSAEPVINGEDLIHTSFPTVASAADLSRETLGDLITTISELYEEQVPAVNVRMRFNKPDDLINLQKGDKIATITSLRGIHVSVEELSKKLERFKIRTIKIGGVVKEENNSQASIQIDSPSSRWFIHSA